MTRLSGKSLNMKGGIIVNKELEEAKAELATVSKAFMEYSSHRNNKKIRTRNVIIIILAILLIGSNVAWFLFERSMETVTETTEEIIIEGIEQNADDSGQNFVVGGDYTNGVTKD